MKNVFYILLIGAVLSACKDASITQKITEVERMQQQVDSCNTIFKTIDNESIKTYQAEAKEQLEFLAKNYKDTANFENARYIDVYNSNWKLMGKLLKGHKRLGDEIVYSQSQLKKLHHDVENALFSDSTYQKYAQGEAIAVSKIIKTTSTLKEWEKHSVNRFNGMHQPIDSVINKLNSRGLR